MRRLSNRDKREFYSGLARLVRSGSSLPTALELLARDTPRHLRNFLLALNERIKQGEPLEDALLNQEPKVSELEASIISASARSGRLDHGCDQLARYFDALVRARSELVSRLAYPVLMLHFALLCVNIQILLSDGVAPYLWSLLRPLAIIYALVIGVWMFWRALIQGARYNMAADRLARRVPGVGVVRERFALARFFATLDAQLEAGVNVWDAFANAARTSDSARIIIAAREAMPGLRSGETLADVLATRRVIPTEFVRTFRVAETAGELDEELTNLAKQSEDMAVAALNRWSEWMPRVAYTMVLIYIGWLIVHWYLGYFGQVSKMMDQ